MIRGTFMQLRVYKYVVTVRSGVEANDAVHLNRIRRVRSKGY